MSRTPRPLATAFAVLGLTAALATGCSDGGSDEPSGISSSASSDGVDALVQTALGQMNAGDEQAAETTFENVLTLDPGNLYAHYNLGLIAQRRGDRQTAMKDYDDALAADESFGPALYNKGILTEATDLEAAVGLYRKAVDADPTFAPAFMRLGFALVHLGQDDEGEKYLGRGIQLDPSMADVKAPSYG